MTVVMDNVKVRDSAVALLFAGLVLKLLHSYALCERVNTQDFRRLQRGREDSTVLLAKGDGLYLHTAHDTHIPSLWVIEASPGTCIPPGRYSRSDPALRSAPPSV